MSLAPIPARASRSVFESGSPASEKTSVTHAANSIRLTFFAAAGGVKERSPDEASLADRLGLTDEVRLACQLRPESEIRMRRLVLDETDQVMSSQLDRSTTKRAGEAKNVTVFFSDIADLTPPETFTI